MNIETLRQSELFAQLPEPALQQILASGQEITVESGAVLMEEGSEPDSMYIVIEGKLDVYKRAGDTELLLGTCGPGELVGELAVLHGHPRSASVRAKTEADLLCIDAECLTSLLTNPGLAVGLLTTVTSRLEDRELQMRQHDRMAALGTLTAGLLHELNNPAAAVVRSVDHLRDAVTSWLDADADLPSGGAAQRLAAVVTETEGATDPLARADAEDRLVAALEEAGIDRAWELAPQLAELGLDAASLGELLPDLAPRQREASLRWLAARGRIRRLLDEAATGAGRISEIVAAVKGYAHVDEAPVQDVDVHAGLEAAVTLLRHKIPPGAEVVRAYHPDLPKVPGHPGDLNSVWTNLIDNALDAIGERGTVTLRTLASGDEVVVQIENTGPSIPPEVLNRVFDPFFTTKPVGRGTGLGLPTAFSVVTRRHHGRLTLTSEPDHTVATVRLPRRRAEGADDDADR